MDNLIYSMNPWWEEKTKLMGIKRNKYLELLFNNLKNKDIIFLSGLRRVGKSTILKQAIHLLIKEKTLNQKIFVIYL